MRYGSKPKVSSGGPSASSGRGQTSSRLSSGARKSRTSTDQPMQSTRPLPASSRLRGGAPLVSLSRSMEKSFLRLSKKPYRDAYVAAEVAHGLSRQIRLLREARGWTQGALAKKLSTTQGVVSRLEDPSYGKYSMQTLLQVASVFDVALLTRFCSFAALMRATWDTSSEYMLPTQFVEEETSVCFYSDDVSSALVSFVTDDTASAARTQLDVDESLPRIVFARQELDALGPPITCVAE